MPCSEPGGPLRRREFISLLGGYAVCAALSLSGCASAPSQQGPITCTAGPDCDAKWSRAASWVAKNAFYKIQTQTDSVVATAGSDDHRPAYTVTKVAQSSGQYQITIVCSCNSLINCDPAVEV